MVGMAYHHRPPATRHQPPIPSHRRVIGVLGGSFNPAHEGHLHISRYALDSLGLDEVWWMVSPRNPLKDKNTLANYEERFRSAERMATHRRIRVTDFERAQGLIYTCDTLKALQARYPRIHFVWLMGADNLAEFHRWKQWQWILAHVPVVIFDRAPYSHSGKAAKAYQRMRKFLIRTNEILINKPAPVLYFAHLRRDPASATAIRKRLGKRA